MTQAAIQTAPEAPVAPPTVAIELGPDVSHYPEQIRTAAEPPKTEPQPTTQESGEAGTSEPPPSDAGPSQEPPKGDTEKNTRRAKGEDAYQRGLREGREQADRERTEHEQTQAREQAQRDQQAQFDQLVANLEAPDYDTREAAGRQLSQLFKGTRHEAALKLAGRNETLTEIGQAITAIKDLEGMDEDGFKEIWDSKTPAEAVKVAFARGQKLAKTTADERIAELEAQLGAERGRRVGSSLTPERQTGSNGTGSRLTLEQYQRMSTRELQKAGITSADIDAMTAELQQEAARNGR